MIWIMYVIKIFNTDVTINVQNAMLFVNLNMDMQENILQKLIETKKIAFIYILQVKPSQELL